MKKILFILAMLASLTISARAQVVVRYDNDLNPGHPSAMLDVRSSDKGFLPPRLTTTERDAIVLPAAGLIIYNITDSVPEYYNGVSWKPFCNCSGENGNFYSLSVSVPQLDNGEHQVATITILGVTPTSGVLVNPGSDPDDADGDVIISARVSGINQVAVKFSNNSNKKNDAKTYLLYLRIFN